LQWPAEDDSRQQQRQRQYAAPQQETKKQPQGLLKDPRRPRGSNKNVRFCDQVTLVAEAEPDGDVGLPNPILERVLRNAGLKSEQDLVVPVDPALSSPHGSVVSTDSSQGSSSSSSASDAAYPSSLRPESQLSVSFSFFFPKCRFPEPFHIEMNRETCAGHSVSNVPSSR
jgi:hypothetical protein